MMPVQTLRQHILENWETIKSQILNGTYEPQPVRRVEIPKPDGGVRLLGIPTVTDRLIQQAISQILSKEYDITFSNTVMDSVQIGVLMMLSEKQRVI